MDATGNMLRDTAAKLFAAHATPQALRRAEQGAWLASAWEAVEQAGLARALLPEHAGGYGILVPDALSLLRVAGAHALPLPLAETMLASWLLAQAGLPVPDGVLTVAPVAAGDAMSLNRAGDGWRLSGVARRVPWGRQAVAAAVLAESDEGWRVA